MLPVLSMVLAVMLGSSCGINMANTNDYNIVLYDTGNYPQAVQYQKDGQDLNSMLSQMGVDMMPGNSQCGISQAYYYIIIFLKK